MKAFFRIAFLLGVACWSTVFAQGRWVKLAPFPEPAEELLGASASGKLYVFCGLAPGWKPIGMVYEYDPGADRWTKKNPMPLPSHHVAFTEYKGKIYAFGGFVLPHSGPAAGVPIDSAREHGPARRARWLPACSAAAPTSLAGKGRTTARCSRSALSRPTTRRRTPGPACRRCRCRAMAWPARLSAIACTW